MQRWQPQGGTMISIPNGLYVLASEAEEWKRRAERAEWYVAGEDLRSDFRTAAEMRAALDALTRRLALAVEVVEAARALNKALCHGFDAMAAGSHEGCIVAEKATYAAQSDLDAALSALDAKEKE